MLVSADKSSLTLAPIREYGAYAGNFLKAGRTSQVRIEDGLLASVPERRDELADTHVRQVRVVAQQAVGSRP